MGVWNFYTSYVWHSTFGTLWLHEASVQTASMSKQRKLPTYWFVLMGNKRDNLFQSKCSYCGYFKVWSTYTAVVEIDDFMEVAC